MRNRMPLIFGLLLVAAIAIAWGGPSIVKAQDPTPTAQAPLRTITANGTGQVFLTPDIAYITIGVRSEGKVASEVLGSNNESADKLVQALRAAGIAANDIRTSNFSIYPQQQYNAQGLPSGEITYVVENSLYVTVRDLEAVGDILDEAVQAGANSIYGIQFDVANKEQQMGAARKAAVDNARQVAEELADAAGVTLGDVQAVTTSSGGFPGPIYGMGGAVAREAAASVPVQTGELAFSVDVTMVFAIR
ncbi:MAG TPA: SIMPL domain-containing protein, partial [Anaerolineales bacterium]|nr:SIMPL domain-containing protein [Anaerolineales bacterium]